MLGYTPDIATTPRQHPNIEVLMVEIVITFTANKLIRDVSGKGTDSSSNIDRRF